MKLIHPFVPPVPSRKPGGYRPYKSQWLKKWIEDQPRFVELDCGHHADLNTRGTTLITRSAHYSLGKKQDEVHCNLCERFAAIIRAVTILEYAGIVLPEDDSDVPPF